MLEDISAQLNWIFFSSGFGRALETELGDARFIVYAMIFLGVLMALEGLHQTLSRRENRSEAINRRIRMQTQGKTDDAILALLKPVEKKGLLGNLPFVGDLRAALRNAGSTISPEIFATACAVGFVVTAAAGSQVTNPLMAFAFAFVIFLVAPLAALSAICRKRMAKLLKQLPDALDLMSRGLRVGHPLNTTLQSVADEMPDPIGSEFGVVVDQVAYGDELTVAMRQLAQRINEEDVHYLSVAITMQASSGGDLARVLTTLARVIRARMALRRKVRAISSEGRLTAYILSALPLIIAGVMTATAPTYYGDVIDYPHFWTVMACIGAAVALNAVILFRLVNFRF